SWAGPKANAACKVQPSKIKSPLIKRRDWSGLKDSWRRVSAAFRNGSSGWRLHRWLTGSGFQVNAINLRDYFVYGIEFQVSNFKFLSSAFLAALFLVPDFAA
ncbi:MAG: hypothetical protein WCE56_01325, partial [Desulfobacterales bacterium]